MARIISPFALVMAMGTGVAFGQLTAPTGETNGVAALFGMMFLIALGIATNLYGPREESTTNTDNTPPHNDTEENTE